MANQPRNRANKGNPAAHRMANDRRKNRRAESWRNGQVRKAARRTAQAEAEAANRRRRKTGEPTPWEAAKRARWERRHPVAAP
jgi:hypothetical protein